MTHEEFVFYASTAAHRALAQHRPYEICPECPTLPPALTQEIAAARPDPEFAGRIRERVHDDAAVLRRLAAEG